MFKFTFPRTEIKLFKGLIIYLRTIRQASSSVSEVILSGGDTIKFSTGKLAKFADGCAVTQIGDTSVMVTAVGKSKATSTGFLPLTVDYRQKAAAAGRIPTNFFRRELGPSEHEILTSRLIDRSLRPLFPSNYTCETQLISNILAMDGINDPVILAINAASAALSVSDIPWLGPIGAVRVGLKDSEVLINPSRRLLNESSLNLIVAAASQNLVIMLEGSGDSVLQQDFMKAIKVAVKECQKIIQGISLLQREFGKPKRDYYVAPIDTELIEKVDEAASTRLREIFTNFSHDKLSRDQAVNDLRNEVVSSIKSSMDSSSEDEISLQFYKKSKEVFRNLILDEGIRCDGRALTDLRKIVCDVDLFRPLHGSALFQRGQTQVLCTVALDSQNSVLQVDPISALTSGLKEKNFFLHYEFPPYATNEIGRMGPAARREIGHGALAEKALRSVIPTDYPFTIRLTSEVLESNGSSSMGTICAGSMALMDSGVPLSAPAAGVAIGLVTRYEGSDTKHLEKYSIMTDILGIEDYLGDMDFKIAGTKKGITALQADIKIPGLPLKVVMEAIKAGCDAKSQIIGIMNCAIQTPRSEKKDSWPVIETLEIPINKKAKFIGHGGVNIKKIMVNTGAQITFDEESGLFVIFAPNISAMHEAKDHINQFLDGQNDPILEFGGIYNAKIVEICEHGVRVTLYPNMKPTLIHTSQLDTRKVVDVKVLGFEVGQEIPVKFFGVDPVSGQMRLSKKVLMGPSSEVLVNLQKPKL